MSGEIDAGSGARSATASRSPRETWTRYAALLLLAVVAWWVFDGWASERGAVPDPRIASERDELAPGAAEPTAANGPSAIDPARRAVDEEPAAAPAPSASAVRNGELLVRVLDLAGHPLSGAYIEVRPDAPDGTPIGSQPLPPSWPEFLPEGADPAKVDGAARQLAVTDARGEFLARALPCDFPLQVFASGSVPPTSGRTVIPSDTARAELELRVVMHGCLRGRIAYADGAPAAHVPVRSFQRGTDGVVRDPIEANDDGRFELCGLANGFTSWRIEVPGESSRCTRIDAPVVDVGTVEIARTHATEVRLILTGAPTALRYDGWVIQAFSNGRLVSSTGAHRSGTTTLELPAGRVQLDLVRGGERVGSCSATVPCGAVEFALGALVAGLAIENAPVPAGVACGMQLRGLDADPSEAGRRRPPCFALPPQHMESLAAWSGAVLELWMLPPGGYDVSLLDAQGIAHSVGSVWLKAGERARIVAPVSGVGVIAGIVRDALGAPVPNLALQAARPALEGAVTRSESTRTRADGAFELVALRSGKWIVFPRSRGPESSEAVVVELAANQRVELELHAGRSGALEVEIGGANGPHARVGVSVVPRGAGVNAAATTRATTDRGGLARFDELCEGEYDVRASWREPGSEAPVVELRSVLVRGGATTKLRFDAADARSVIRFTRDGRPFDAWSGGVVFSSSGRSHLRELPGVERRYTATLGRGPHLFLLYAPPEFPRIHPDRDLNHCQLAYVEDVPEPGTPLEVALRGADIAVRMRGDGGALPLARLIRIGPFEDVWGKAGFDRLMYFDASGDARRFADVPVGAVIELENAGWGARGPVERVHVTSTAELVVEWPPAR
ncbi:MAG: carboxypeptidase regulatory-like domain-containing protein [Planctomycetota bacterium]|nr:MAG: carboxypeptidase regulatory-like domain-containing protein [Planctomycetota bacterium]